jgi:hypothetical protein
VERETLPLLERERPARWGCYHPVVLDHTTCYWTSATVWGICTVHEASARSPNRAATVRTHNWMMLGDLMPGPPWVYLPHMARLYGRQNQLPAGETVQIKTAWAVELLCQADAESSTPILGVFDGAYAGTTVVELWVNRGPEQQSMEILTRLRVDARLSQPMVSRARPKGRRPTGGERCVAPQHYVHWFPAWRTGRTWVYGRSHIFRYTHLRCRWSVSGPRSPMHVFVIEVPGYQEPGCLVTTPLDLSAPRRGGVCRALSAGRRPPRLQTTSRQGECRA